MVIYPNSIIFGGRCSSTGNWRGVALKQQWGARRMPTGEEWEVGCYLPWNLSFLSRSEDLLLPWKALQWPLKCLRKKWQSWIVCNHLWVKFSLKIKFGLGNKFVNVDPCYPSVCRRHSPKCCRGSLAISENSVKAKMTFQRQIWPPCKSGCQSQTRIKNCAHFQNRPRVVDQYQFMICSFYFALEKTTK